MSKILFSIVIPTCDRLEHLCSCLNTLAPEKQTLAFINYEVIVTDDGKIEAKSHIQKEYHWVKWVKGPQKGPAANRNNGAKYAIGSYFVFIDDDCIPDKGWLEGYANFLEKHPKEKVLEGRTYVNMPRKSLAEVAPLNATGGYLWSCNFLIEAELFETLGGFDEKYSYAAMEDIDLRTRILKAGYEFPFVQDASVIHPWRDKGGWKKLVEHEKSTLLYLSLHPEEVSKINSKYYLEKTLRRLIKFTIPGIFKYKLKGVDAAIQEHVADIRMFFILLFKRSWDGRK